MTSPDVKPKLAKLLRMLDTPSESERRIAWGKLVSGLKQNGLSWVDVGDAFEQNLTEAEVIELAEHAEARGRADGVEAGIKIGMVRAANNGSGNGHGGLALPPPVQIAEYVQSRRALLKDDSQRRFADEMVSKTRRRVYIAPGTLGFLISLYVKHGGRV